MPTGKSPRSLTNSEKRVAGNGGRHGKGAILGITHGRSRLFTSAERGVIVHWRAVLDQQHASGEAADHKRGAVLGGMHVSLPLSVLLAELALSTFHMGGPHEALLPGLLSVFPFHLKELPARCFLRGQIMIAAHVVCLHPSRVACLCGATVMLLTRAVRGKRLAAACPSPRSHGSGAEMKAPPCEVVLISASHEGFYSTASVFKASEFFCARDLPGCSISSSGQPP